MSSNFRLPIRSVPADGLTAWLVEDHSVPVVSLAWSWAGTGSQVAEKCILFPPIEPPAAPTKA